MANGTDPLKNILKGQYLSYLDVGKSYSVKVTHINSPDSFFVRLNDCVKCLIADNIILGVPGDKAKLEDLRINSLVIFKSGATNKYSRGRIQKIHEVQDDFDIFGIDNGRFEKKVPLEKIYTFANPDYMLIKGLAVHCKLAFCTPLTTDGSWTDDVIETMKSYVGNCRTSITVTQNLGSIYSVSVDSAESPDDVATLLALVGCSTYLSKGMLQYPTRKKVKKHSYPKNRVKVGDSLVVRTLHGKSLSEFCVAELDSYNNYESETREFHEIQRQQRRLKTDELLEGMPVVATFDYNGYQRAIIKEKLSSDKVLVYAVDLGKSVEVSTSNLKPLDSGKFFRKPPVAMLCSAVNHQLSNDELCEYLYPGYEFSILIKEVGCEYGSHPYIVELSSLSEDFNCKNQ